VVTETENRASDASMIVRDYIGIRPDEVVTVLFDRGRRDEGVAVAAAARDLGASVIAVDVSQHVDDVLGSESFWVDPPPHLRAVVQASNVSIFVADETYTFRLDHHVRHLWRTGAVCSIYKVDVGLGRWNFTAADIAEAERCGAALLAAIDGHETVRVTTELGTDLRFVIKGRGCLVVPPVPERGHPYGISVPMWSEYNWAPVEELTEGVAVVDGITEATSLLHVVTEPFRIAISGGRATSFSGGADAADLEALLATDSGAAVVGELGIGANPRAWAGTEAEKALLGTIHLGFGDNGEYPGGRNVSAIHCDVTLRDVSIEVDGHLVMRHGRLLVG
jgi:Thermophilic metalloprotease (M29)